MQNLRKTRPLGGGEGVIAEKQFVCPPPGGLAAMRCRKRNYWVSIQVRRTVVLVV